MKRVWKLLHHPASGQQVLALVVLCPPAPETRGHELHRRLHQQRRERARQRKERQRA